jgi:hypothetical protein
MRQDFPVPRHPDEFLYIGRDLDTEKPAFCVRIELSSNNRFQGTPQWIVQCLFGLPESSICNLPKEYVKPQGISGRETTYRGGWLDPNTINMVPSSRSLRVGRRNSVPSRRIDA